MSKMIRDELGLSGLACFSKYLEYPVIELLRDILRLATRNADAVAQKPAVPALQISQLG